MIVTWTARKTKTSLKTVDTINFENMFFQKKIFKKFKDPLTLIPTGEPTSGPHCFGAKYLGIFFM